MVTASITFRGKCHMVVWCYCFGWMDCFGPVWSVFRVDLFSLYVCLSRLFKWVDLYENRLF